MKLILGLVLCLIATVARAQPATQVYTGTPTKPVGASNPLAVTTVGTVPLPTGAATAANQTNGSQVTQITGTVTVTAAGAATAANQTNGTQQTQVVGTVPLPTGAATAANQEVTVAGLSAGSAQGVQGVTGGVPMQTRPSTRTIVPLDVSAIGTGGTAVTALTAGHATAGGKLVTANAAGLCVDQHGTAGTVTGTPSTTMCVPQNVVFDLVPSAGAVSVNSTAAAAIGGEGLN